MVDGAAHLLEHAHDAAVPDRPAAAAGPLKNPDRALFRFVGADEVLISGGSVDIVSGNRQIEFVDGPALERIRIQNLATTFPITVKIYAPTAPWGPPIHTFTYDSGTNFVWRG